jgi:hypothetical protein
MAVVREVIRRVLPPKTVPDAVSTAYTSCVKSPRQYPQRHSAHVTAAPKRTRVGAHTHRATQRNSCRDSVRRNGSGEEHLSHDFRSVKASAKAWGGLGRRVLWCQTQRQKLTEVK